MGPLPSERFAELVALGKLITDYVGEGEAVVPNEDEGLDDDIGVAVEVSEWVWFEQVPTGGTVCPHQILSCRKPLAKSDADSRGHVMFTYMSCISRRTPRCARRNGSLHSHRGRHRIYLHKLPGPCVAHSICIFAVSSYCCTHTYNDLLTPYCVCCYAQILSNAV